MVNPDMMQNREQTVAKPSEANYNTADQKVDSSCDTYNTSMVLRERDEQLGTVNNRGSAKDQRTEFYIQCF